MRVLQYLQKNQIYFLPMKTWKNRPQKLLIISPKYFFSSGPAAQTSQKLIFHIVNMSQDPSVYWFVVAARLLLFLITKMKALREPSGSPQGALREPSVLRPKPAQNFFFHIVRPICLLICGVSVGGGASSPLSHYLDGKSSRSRPSWPGHFLLHHAGYSGLW